MKKSKKVKNRQISVFLGPQEGALGFFKKEVILGCFLTFSSPSQKVIWQIVTEGGAAEKPPNFVIFSCFFGIFCENIFFFHS